MTVPVTEGDMPEETVEGQANSPLHGGCRDSLNMHTFDLIVPLLKSVSGSSRPWPPGGRGHPAPSPPCPGIWAFSGQTGNRNERALSWNIEEGCSWQFADIET